MNAYLMFGESYPDSAKIVLNSMQQIIREDNINMDLSSISKLLILDHRSVNQTFIVNKKRGIISEGECPSHNITLHNKSFDTSSRHTLSRFTKYLWITLPFLYHGSVLVIHDVILRYLSMGKKSNLEAFLDWINKEIGYIFGEYIKLLCICPWHSSKKIGILDTLYSIQLAAWFFQSLYLQI